MLLVILLAILQRSNGNRDVCAIRCATDPECKAFKYVNISETCDMMSELSMGLYWNDSSDQDTSVCVDSTNLGKEESVYIRSSESLVKKLGDKAMADGFTTKITFDEDSTIRLGYLLSLKWPL